VRARRAGFKLTIAPDAVIHHNPSSSTSKLGAALLLRYHYRNAHLFNMKNAPFGIKILLPFWSIWIIMKQAAKIFVRKNSIASWAILSGVLDFYKGRFGKIGG
jgi:GT2 family glycosyltransferase